MKGTKGVGANTGRARKANNMYRGITDASGEDSRFNIKLGKTRKQRRKLERKNAGKLRHEKKMDWLKRRKSGKSERNDGVEATSRELRYDPEQEGEHSDDSYQERIGQVKHQKSVEDMELEYLEHQLMKNRKGKGRNGKVDLLQELKSEFLNDGFDDDFLDFLSNITRMGDHEVVLDRDSITELRQDKHEQESVEEDDDDDDDKNDDTPEEDDDPENDSDSESEKNEKRTVRFAPEVVKPSRQKKLEKPKKEAPSFETSKRLQIGLVNRLSEGNFTLITKDLIGVYNDLIYHVCLFFAHT